VSEVDWNLVLVVKAMGEIYSRTVSDAAAMMFLADLSSYPSDQIKIALQKCRQELRAFPTVADVLARIPDGRPGVEEAWAMIPKDEESSVVWTDEMAEAMASARPLLMEGDPVAARMAFKETYTKLVSANRGKPVRWWASFGFEKSGREAVVRDAVDRGRLTQSEAQLLLPEYEASHSPRKQIAGPGFTDIGDVIKPFLKRE